MDLKIKRALISVSDKEGIVGFSRSLREMGIEIYSTGGTYKTLAENDIEVFKVEDITGFPEMLDGRVKTLHPLIHGGILADRQNPKHLSEAEKKGVRLIDMVVVNLYPFKKTVSREDVTLGEAIENIDIGGPTMIRSAAKNHKSVAVLVDPEDYSHIIEELKNSNGSLEAKTLFALAVKAFQHTCEYDSVIFNYFSEQIGDLSDAGIRLRPYLDIDCTSAEARRLKRSKGHFNPDIDNFRDSEGEASQDVLLRLSKISDLRYGENPHQKASYYKMEGAPKNSFVNAKQLQGKQLSYNNLLDANAAFGIVKEFEQPCVAVIKHNNPCGAAVSGDVAQAYKKAYECDPVSAFGSIVASNKQWTIQASGFLIDKYVEVLIAPSYQKEALDAIKGKKDLRVLQIDYDAKSYLERIKAFGFRTKKVDIKSLDGGILIQDLDEGIDDRKDFEIVTAKSPTQDQMEDMVFGWQLIKNVKSNAIVLVKDKKTVGIGAGQMSRVDSVRIAIEKSEGRAEGSVMISDAFFPFKDAIELAGRYGIKAVIQPGGSVNDQEVIDSCNDNDIAMLFTGKRHFKH